MKSPLVSVIMCVYNEEKYLIDSIDSILNQSFTNFEFVIVNDGSYDKTKNIIEDYAIQDNRIKMINNDVNLGVTKSANKGIRVSKGELIARMDAGDISYPERLNKQVEYLIQNRDISIVGTWAHWIGENGLVMGDAKFARLVDKTCLYGTGATIQPSIIFRRKLIEKIGPYDEKYQVSEDLEFYMRTIKNGFSIGNLQEYLINIRRRETGISLSRIRASAHNQFFIKTKYLPYLFTFQNVFYTMKSLGGSLLPTPIVKIFIDKQMRRNY